MTLIERLGRFNRAHPWSHNAAFTPVVMWHAWRVARAGGARALDVGCGSGNLVGGLARILPDVVGLEPDPVYAAHALSRHARSARVRIEARSFGPEERAAYDLVVFVASLHHLALEAALREARACLRSGGRIVIVGVVSEDHPDLRSRISVALNPVVGWLRHPRGTAAEPLRMGAPVAAPAETFEQVALVMESVLPGVRMRRRLFWRYTAVWKAR
ncbi:class I SAM-dependent methyltransferase [Demequina gelatinilytica]|uniref:class I SAM-dependent methyltransferase n=1 Tax=Demequina gelatinilytica TaxID=1638980 RepID=UPI0007823DA1|nr:class I SAM-dependent methyltransferase [Demequina gelatinilytica]